VGIRRLSIGTVMVTVVLLSALLPAAPANAVTISCGKSITTSIIVSNDLSGCLGNGLVVRASNITIDLNGHTIDGTGAGIGISNNGFDNVTIRNGTIHQFNYGIVLQSGTTESVVESMTLTHDDYALQISGAGDNTIVGNTISMSSDYGLFIENALGSNVITDNTVRLSSDTGMLLRGSGSNLITNNIVEGNGDRGIWLISSSGPSVITGNIVKNNQDSGVIVELSNDNTVEANTISGNFDSGIMLSEAHSNTVRGNDVRNNSSGIELSNSNRNFVLGNNAGNSQTIGIEVQESSNNRIRGNISSWNNGTGIDLSGSGNFVEGNRTNKNGSDGMLIGAGECTIDICSDNRIKLNIANYNAGWGIHAAGLDKGGNKAKFNAEPAQCWGVICSSR
jgi:parallel beta-helix repeat protein